MFKIENEDSLNKLNKKIGNIKNKVIVVRFKMTTCIYCIKSQPAWKAMTTNVKHDYTLGPETMFVQIDSTLADSFTKKHKIMDEHNKAYQVHAFPEHVLIVKGIAFKSNADDVPTTLDHILTKLEHNKHIFKKINIPIKSTKFTRNSIDKSMNSNNSNNSNTRRSSTNSTNTRRSSTGSINTRRSSTGTTNTRRSSNRSNNSTYSTL